VISPPVEHSAGQLLIKTSELDPQELRFSLLFWDKLDYPSNNLIGMPAGRDAEFLEAAGILTRTHVTIRGGGDMADLYRQAHIDAFTRLDSAEPGTWSIATGERSISFLDNELAVGRGALVTIHRAIPVPDKAVHLQELLDFKAKRQSELLALRHHLEAIYQRVASASDDQLALNSAIEALDCAVTDYIKSTRGLGMTMRLASLEASINIGALGAGVVAYAKGLSASDAILMGLVAGAGSLIAIKGGFGLSRARSAETPFRYVSSYHKDLFPPG